MYLFVFLWFGVKYESFQILWDSRVEQETIHEIAPGCFIIKWEYEFYDVKGQDRGRTEMYGNEMQAIIQQDSSAVDWSPRTGVSVLLKRPLHKRASQCHIWMHVEAVIVYDVEELMARLFIVTEPLKRSVLPPTIFHQLDGSTVAMQRSAVA